MKLTALELVTVTGRRPAPTSDGELQVKPLHTYPEDRFQPALPEAGGPFEAIYIRAVADTGDTGFYGPIDPAAAFVVAEGLRAVVLGTDPLAGTRVWDRMARSDRHSRHGHVMMGISAVDNVLWDLRGKHFGVPVWRLLGGPTRDDVPAYASALGSSHDPERLAARAGELAAAGFGAQKWFLAHGPGDGPDGLRRNVTLVERLRAALGADYPIMFDASMGWDRGYATRFARAVEHLTPAWLEEPFGPEQLEAYADLRSRTSVPIAAGEHLYGRFEVQRYLQAGALDVVQSDPEWCGGVTELVRICTVASLHDVPVIPHGHGMHAAIHVVASQSPATCPLAEYLVHIMPGRHHFELDPPVPVGGRFPLPEEPGFGIELDPAKVEQERVW
jgi:L-rhamnonate dehydratase